ncbi:MAG: response regulator [Myxococcales bacterium]|nr:response regulator [Myxococcales bacterium]
MSKRKTILVIDDSDICLTLARDALEQAGYDVVAASSPLGATRLLRASNAAAVVLDVAMPAMNGDKLVTLLKRASKVPVPILLHSDRPSSEIHSLAAACGASAAIEKAPDCAPLVAAVDRFVGARGGF